MSTTAPNQTDEDVLARALKESEETKPLEDPEELENPADVEVIDEGAEPARDSELDDIEAQVAHRDWHVEGDIIVGRPGQEQQRHWDKVYVQKPLSFSAMLQFTGLIGEKLSEAMAGPEGLTIDGVMGSAGSSLMSGTGISRDDFSSVDSFVKGLAKLASHAPDVVEDCQCIWLRIPHAERAIVKEIWSRSPTDGGLSVADGEEMLEIFIAQNYREVEDFFVERLPRLARRVTKLRKLAATQQPKRSKLTPPTTPKR